MKPAISVIMSIYNEPIEWLAESVNSILLQTFIDFEFIIVNDNPNRLENKHFLSATQKNDQRILVIENDINIGLTKSLNKGLNAAKGKYIARMDADDVSLPERFQLQHDFLEQNIEYGLCGTNISLINEEGKAIQGLIWLSYSDRDIRDNFSFSNPMCHPTFMVRTEIIREHNINYNENFKYSQDYEFIRELLSWGKVHNIKKVLLYYRKSQIQISQSKMHIQDQYTDMVRLKYIASIVGWEYSDQLVSPKKMRDLARHLKEDQSIEKKLRNNALLSLLFNYFYYFGTSLYLSEFFSYGKYGIKNKFKLLKYAFFKRRTFKQA